MFNKQKIILIEQKLSIAADILESKLADLNWICNNILNFNDKDIKLLIKNNFNYKTSNLIKNHFLITKNILKIN